MFLLTKAVIKISQEKLGTHTTTPQIFLSSSLPKIITCMVNFYQVTIASGQMEQLAELHPVSRLITRVYYFPFHDLIYFTPTL